MFLVIASACFLVFSAVKGADVPGYYWRDFDGSIPSDALEGGLDINNRPIYIGQVFKTFLIPAKIYYNDKMAYYEYRGKEFGVNCNIKILCTQHPELFKWIPTDNDKIKKITSVHLVNGGYEPGCTTYIGRVRSNGEIVVGKALADNHPNKAGLHVTKDGKGTRHTSFEVLSFQLLPKYLIDVRHS